MNRNSLESGTFLADLSTMRSGIHSTRSGAALIIILAFMVMLLGLLLAFFSRTTLQQQVSQSSSSLVSGDVLARGVVESIVGDLLQEITAGSSNTTVVTGSVTNTLYFPAANPNQVYSNMVPSISGFTTNAGLENLLKVSGPSPVYSVVNSGGTISNGPIRGTANATTNISYNGRAISMARWNKPILMPLQYPNPTNTTTIIDYTPINNFTNAIPKWILVARNGSNPTTWSTNAGSDMRWSSTNGTTVIGRYAYIIYNEGGLLDANVVGFPSTLTNSSVTNPSYVPYKAGSYSADLTMLGLVTNQINGLVGWRNVASALVPANNTFPTYNISTSGATNYGAAMVADTNGLLITYQNTNNSTYAPSDRRFTSRQQLIAFLTGDTYAAGSGRSAHQGGLSYALSALPYLGTFSRSLDQPTYFWDSNRPKIIAPGYSLVPHNGSPAQPNADQVLGGNSAYMNDDLVNPSFSTIRVTNTFTRYDRTHAVVGEPLVKKRFPLSRLAWITCKGPSADLYASAPADPVITQLMSNGVSLQTITNGTASNVLSSFGLTWTAGPGTGGIGGYWTYSHGIDYTVGCLSDVAALSGPNAREPDFFEMLKAGLSAGSLAKGGAIAARNYAYDQRGIGTRDTRLDNQIIQTGANIISQTTPDCFPTFIKFTNSMSNNIPLIYPFWGVNDLPYLQGVTQINLLVATSNPLPINGKPETNTTLLASGTNVTIVVPIIWNPHAAPTIAIPAGLAPAKLRVCLSCLDLANPTTDSSLQDNMYTNNLGGPSYKTTTYSTNADGTTNTNSINVLDTAATSTTPWPKGTYAPSNGLFFTMPASGDAGNTSMTFSYATNLYREPTPLMRAGIPSGSGLALDANNVMPSAWSSGIPEKNSGQSFIGFYAGTFPNRWSVTNVTAGSPPTTNTVTYTANSDIFMGGNYCPTVSIEYQPPGSSAWIPYRQYPMGIENAAHVPYNAIENDRFGNAFALDPQSWIGNIAWNQTIMWDPRASRWGMVSAIYNGTGDFLDAAKTTIPSQRSGAGGGVASYGITLGEVTASEHIGTNTGAWGAYPYNPVSNVGGCLSWYFVNADGFIVDADGVIRLGMGAAYNSSALTTNGMPLATPAAPSSRPIILHRPLRNVGELGYVFSDTPWRNIDFATPQSGCSALLDIFCIQENGRPDAVVAGKVDLNTRQAPVLAALIAGGLRDEQPSTSDTPLTTNEASVLATNLVTRTSGTKGPLRNIGDLVGRWISGVGSSNGVPSLAASQPVYDGFTADIATNSLYTNSSMSVNSRVQRFLGAPIRALANTGQVGAWNLLIDVVVQTGKYPASAANLDQFQVQGETRYWVHLAIDRISGKVLEKSIERVNE